MVHARQARTIPLPKVDEVPLASQIRPISILCQLYRTWGRVVSTQIIAHFSRVLPCWLTGFLRRRGPLDACYLQAALVEKARMRNASASGFCLDLVKCFNTMCTRSVVIVLRAMKLPPWLLAVWSESLNNLTRFWVVADECSMPVEATRHDVSNCYVRTLLRLAS